MLTKRNITYQYCNIVTYLVHISSITIVDVIRLSKNLYFLGILYLYVYAQELEIRSLWLKEQLAQIKLVLFKSQNNFSTSLYSSYVDSNVEH